MWALGLILPNIKALSLVRIPTINDPYYKTTLTGTQLNVDYQSGELTGGRGKGSGITLAFRRNVALYWNYVYNF